jgi:hypothetical protein
VQYEKFYASEQFVTPGQAFRALDWDRSSRMVDGMAHRTPMPVTPLQMGAE